MLLQMLWVDPLSPHMMSSWQKFNNITQHAHGTHLASAVMGNAILMTNTDSADVKSNHVESSHCMTVAFEVHDFYE